MTALFALLFETLDERLRLRRPSKQTLTKVFPHHWSFLFGEAALFSFVILVLTGIFLTMFYTPSIEPVTYSGSAELYDGQEIPAAFESIIRLSNDVPGGLFMRRLHRGAAYAFTASVVLHALRILLTGAFRRPREVNYHLGLILLLIGLGLVGTGQALPYDVVEGAALRVVYSFLLAIPFVGESVVFWVFGGDYFGDAIPRFYVIHVLILPMIFAALVVGHLLILVRQRHTQFPRAGIDGHRFVVGRPLWPSQFATSASLMIGLAGVLSVFAVLVPWSDFLLYGPADAGITSSTNHPDWWLSWIEGALVLYPGWEAYPIPGVVISPPFVAGILLPLLVFATLFAYPWVDRRLAPYAGDVHVLDWPFDVPARAGIALAGLTFIVLLTVASHVDYLSLAIGVSAEALVIIFRVLTLAGPPTVFLLVYLRARAYKRSAPGRPGTRL